MNKKEIRKKIEVLLKKKKGFIDQRVIAEKLGENFFKVDDVLRELKKEGKVESKE